MANVTAYDNGDPIIRAAGSSNAGVPDFVIIRNTIDAGKATIAEDDTFDILEIPANTVVLSVFLKVISAEATVTVALGVTGDDADGFMAAQSLAATGAFQGTGAYLDSSGAYVQPPFFDADTMLTGLAEAAALQSAEIEVTVVGYNIG
jgi:hypothetical protein